MGDGLSPLPLEPQREEASPPKSCAVRRHGQCSTPSTAPHLSADQAADQALIHYTQATAEGEQARCQVSAVFAPTAVITYTTISW